MFSCLKVKLSSFLFVAFFHPIYIIKPGCAYGRLIKVLNCDIFCYKIHFIAAAFILFDEIRDILPSCHFEQDNAEKVIDRNIDDCVVSFSLHLKIVFANILEYRRRVMKKNVAILADSLPLSASRHNTMFLKNWQHLL